MGRAREAYQDQIVYEQPERRFKFEVFEKNAVGKGKSRGAIFEINKPKHGKQE